MILDDSDIGYLDMVLETYLGNPFLELSDEEKRDMPYSDVEAHEQSIAAIRELKTRVEMFLYGEQGYDYQPHWNERQRAMYDALMAKMPEEPSAILIQEAAEVIQFYCYPDNTGE